MLTALTESGPNEVQMWVAKYGITFPVMPDPTYVVWDLYNLSNARPYYVVLDRDMTVRSSASGVPGHVQAEQTVLEILAGE